MNKPTLSGPAEGFISNVPALSLGTRFEPRRRPAHSPIEMHVRRLNYFMDLLETGYRHALQPDPLPRSLRAERIALGIDVPELDTIPLWSAQRSDGAVAIPFVEFVMAEIGRTLQQLADEAGAERQGVRDDLLRIGAALRHVLEQVSPGGSAPPPRLPRLGDIYLTREILDEIRGPLGLLPAIARGCDALLAAESVRPGH